MTNYEMAETEPEEEIIMRTPTVHGAEYPIAQVEFVEMPTEAEPVKKLSISDLHKLLIKKARDTYDVDFLAKCLARDEVGVSELFTSIVQGRICFDNTENEWYFFDNLHWVQETGKNIRQLACDVTSANYWQLAEDKEAEATQASARIESLKAQRKAERGNRDAIDAIDTELRELESTRDMAKGQAKEAKKAAKSMYKLQFIRNGLEFAKATLQLGIDGDEWDTNINLLGVENGVIDLRTGQMVQPSPSQYIRTVAPVPFLPNATCPQWEKSLTEIFNDDTELMHYIQRFLGYAMSGTCHESDFLVWHGSGRNGKEFLLNRVRNVLGPRLSGTVEAELLLKSKNIHAANGATPALMALRGRRLAWASETDEGRTMNLAAMKDLSGGHTLTGRHLHKGQVEWERTHTLILLTNHRPHINSNAIAEWDRLKLIPFTQSFVNQPDGPNQRKKNPELEKQIDGNELSGILNWLIDGCLAWRKGGLNEPTQIKSATAQYRRDEDTLGQFIEDSCICGDEFKSSHKALYNAYVEWCAELGERNAMGSRTFGRKLDERGHENKKGTGGVRMRSGIEVLPVNGFA